MHLTWPSVTRVYDSDRSNDAVAYKPRYSSLNQYSLRNIKERWGASLPIRASLVLGRWLAIPPKIRSSLPQAWDDFLDRLECCLDVWDVCCRGYSYCSPGIFISKVESAQFGNPLACFSISIVILARGHGSGSVDRQCNNSEVSSGDITGSAPPCGR